MPMNKNVLFVILELNFGPLHLPRKYVPYNLKLLATILKRRGHDILFCHEKDLGKLDLGKIDIVCLSIISENAFRAYKIADFFRSRNKKVIIGGIHASMLPEEAKKHADHVVVGEADLIICDVIEGKYREKVIHGKRVENLDGLPPIDNDLTKEKKYLELSTSRGCPYKCIYCTIIKMLGNKHRVRSPENIMTEIENFRDPRMISFVDDNFTFDRERAKDILLMLKERGINSSFITQTNINIYKDRVLLKLLGELNFSLYVGIEYTYAEGLKAINKGQNMIDIKKAIRTIKDHGIKVNSWLMLGSDADEPKTINQNAENFLSLDLDFPMLAMMTPFAGSDVYNTLEREGRLISKDWSKYNMAMINYLPKKMKAYELQKKYLDMCGEFYNAKRMKRVLYTYLTRYNFDYSPIEKIFVLPNIIRHQYNVNRSINSYIDYLEKKDL